MARIFIVDDELYIQTLYSDILERAGHEVVERAFNGVEAVVKYELIRPPPDLILMDHRMPIKNGMQAAAEILRMDPAAAVLVVSADLSVKDKAEGSGVAGFVEKPFNMVDLLKKIERIVAEWSLRRAEGSEALLRKLPVGKAP